MREELFKNQDLKYRDFHAGLLPTISKDIIIGVRVPVLRALAKQAFTENAYNECYYYEERMIYGFTLGLKKCSVQEHIDDIKSFVPMINNWAICDCCGSSFKFVKKDLNRYYDLFLSYIGKGEYETRFAVIMLMNYYLVDEYIDRVLDILYSIESDRYYVNMGVAWALSVAFVKYMDKVMPVIKSKTLPPDIQNKAIQKIKDSLQVSKEIKQEVNEYKI
ncbi:MAG: DNA alkylation repair protein [Eubacterium sp.]